MKNKDKKKNSGVKPSETEQHQTKQTREVK